MKKLLIIVPILLLSAVWLGRILTEPTYGGHHDRKNGGYHFHNSGTVNKSSPKVIDKIAAEGAMPYTPTRSEWLTMLLNSTFNTDYKNHKISYYTDSKNTITVLCVYHADVDFLFMNDRVQDAKKRIEGHAKRYGWDSWVKIEVKYSRLKQ